MPESNEFDPENVPLPTTGGENDLYVVSHADALALNLAMPPGAVFAAEEVPGFYVHDRVLSQPWMELLDAVVFDAAVAVEGNATPTYAEYLAAHPTVAQLKCKIYRYVDHDVGLMDQLLPPRELNYRVELTRRLHPDREFVFGELRHVRYSADSTTAANGAVTYADVVVDEDYAYTRDPEGFALSRRLTIGWLREDGSVHPTTKVMEKVYTPIERIKEGKRRRQNIVDELEITVAGFLIAASMSLDLGRALLKAWESDIYAFVEAGTQDLLARSQSEDDPAHDWLDSPIDAEGTTFRQFLGVKLNMWAGG